ncbi:DUF2927 domain-containing protein [Terasakiella sp. A23]|uniref:DUF2927 domain-containing protein n=1 Tax=Terasakiella sp. FCG-A23 TaxID=3080561 RepID=UPI002955D859|nr:DUF2927 domain-containing protein [Terasakiella sp. A23]MDV7339141.1 DUF2927 domain-containing protein [Terasakiella sp. A23]
MKWMFVFVAVFWATNADANANAQKETVNLETLINQFNSVVFIHEHGKSGREAKPLVKWQGPIVFAVTNAKTKENLKQLGRVMGKIRKLTKLDVSQVKKGGQANMHISFHTQAELKKTLKKGINCKGTLKGNGRTFAITFGKAIIPNDRPDKTMHCIVEETVQLLGLTNDSTIIKNSIFHEESDRTSMSVSDLILLKALYDPRMRPGMKMKEAQPALRVVMKDILDEIARKQKAKKK